MVSFRLKNYHFANIGRLLQLKYLILQHMSELSELPEQIGDLGCLETLDVRRTGIHNLPATIVKLRKLVDLLADSGVRFPDGIAKMQSLEVLKQVMVFRQPVNFLIEFGQLKNLRKQLGLDFATGKIYTVGVEECKKLIFTSLHNLGTQNLHSLKIVRGDIFLQEPSFSTPLSLQKMKIISPAFLRVPNWVGSLVNLQQLCLQVDGVGQEDLCILGGLRALLILDLQEAGENYGYKRLTVSAGVGFRCLRQFLYETCNGMDLVFTEGSMPKLQKLVIGFNGDKTEFLISGSSRVFGIENLPCLDALTCKVRSRFHKTTKAAKSSMERAVSTHPNRPTLLFKHFFRTQALFKP